MSQTPFRKDGPAFERLISTKWKMFFLTHSLLLTLSENCQLVYLGERHNLLIVKFGTITYFKGQGGNPNYILSYSSIFPPRYDLLYNLSHKHSQTSPLDLLLVFFLFPDIRTLISWIITRRSELLQCPVNFRIMLIFLCGGKRCVWVLLQTDTSIYTWALFHQPGLINN